MDNTFATKLACLTALWLVGRCLLKRGRPGGEEIRVDEDGDFWIPPKLNHLQPLRIPTLRHTGSTQGFGRACSVALLQSVLPPELFEALQQEVDRLVVYFHQTDDTGEDVRGEVHLNCTFWCPLAGLGNSPPSLALARNPIESAIHYLVSACPELRQLLPLDRVTGVEWWFHIESTQDPPKEFHSDCDVRLVSVSGRFVSALTSFPLVSSVLYLDEALARPTVVFGQAQGQSGALVPSLPAAVALAFPKPNQLFLFQGDRRHAVFHSPVFCAQDGLASRRTMLLNFWEERPSGAQNLPKGLVRPTSALTSHRANACELINWQLAHLPLSSFVFDLLDWRAQRVPASVCALLQRACQQGPGFGARAAPPSLLLLLDSELECTGSTTLDSPPLDWTYD
eukprot:gb/GEZN01008630.1/.p1 GENE.gb/GEZN01008630.1/~~gb/GEZN01008630.1/.p1  ORF type:complete len:396 (+),score=56.36 gb/GEZN01008630.1/:106-1293(+)